jgi:hypothetical protein
MGILSTREYRGLKMNDKTIAPISDRNLSLTPQAITSADIARRVAEVQGEIMIAQAFPRNETVVFEGILRECESNRALAEQALYSYPRGGKAVTGPSIRLAEALARHWGHLDMGIREISNESGSTEMEAFAWDKQTNVRDSRRFMVKHERSTKQGTTKLTDGRDIYELGANMGARRKRACILSIIPGYLVDAAVEACKRKIASSELSTAERIRKMVTSFGKEFSVSVEMLEKYLGHTMDDISKDEIVDLVQVYNSLKDGMTKRDDWFKPEINKTVEQLAVPK